MQPITGHFMIYDFFMIQKPFIIQYYKFIHLVGNINTSSEILSTINAFCFSQQLHFLIKLKQKPQRKIFKNKWQNYCCHMHHIFRIKYDIGNVIFVYFNINNFLAYFMHHKCILFAMVKYHLRIKLFEDKELYKIKIKFLDVFYDACIVYFMSKQIFVMYCIYYRSLHFWFLSVFISFFKRGIITHIIL